MQMSDGEIVRMYKESASPKEQIKILAELNCCGSDKIKQILFANGCSEITPTKRGKKGRPRKDTLDESLKPEDTVCHEDENPYCKVEADPPTVEEEPPVIQEPHKPCVPENVIAVVKARIDSLETEVWAKTKELGTLLEDIRQLRIWLEGVEEA